MEPSNTDIFRKVQDIEKGQGEMHAMIKDHETRLRPLENWKIAYEAAAKALEGIHTSPASNTNKDFTTFVIKVIGMMTGIVALLYLMVQQLAK